MIQHIVTFKFKEENKIQNCIKAKLLLEELVLHISELKSMKVGINSAEAPQDNWDLILLSEFENFEDLATYQVHPKHKEVANFIGSIRTERASIDFSY